MHKWIKHFFCFLLIILYTFVIVGQSPYVFRYLSKKDGLSQVSVFAIAQDNAGFLWFGTRDGLNRYDGYHFKVYKNTSEANSLISNDVRVIYYDTLIENLWIGTFDGLSMYHALSDDFESYKHDDTPNSLSSNEVHCILRDHRDRLWVGTATGLNLYDDNKKQFTRYLFSDNPQDDFFNLSIEAILQDHEGKLWVGTSKGLYFLDDSKNISFKRIDGNEKTIHFYNENIKALIEDAKGNFWVGNMEGALNYWNRKSDEIKIYQNQKDKTGSLSNNNIRAMAFDASGKLWVGTFEGLNIFDEKTQSFIVYKKTDYKSIGLSDSSIKAIFKDKRGTMWVGTYYGGVNHTDANYQRFQNFVYSPFTNELSADVVSSFVEDEKGNLWIGTEGGGLNYYDTKTKLFSNYKHQRGVENTISGNNVKQLMMDGDQLWIGTFNQGLNVFNTKSKNFRYFKEQPGNSKAISNNNVYGLHKDGQFIWTLTYGGGLDIFDKENSIFLHYKNNPLDSLSISSDLGRVFLETSNKELWIGTEKGINLVIKDNNGLPASFKSYLTNEKIYTLQEDHKHNIWIGTISNGLYEFNPKANTFEHYTTESGLPGNTVFGILEDNNKNLWLSTNFGLSKFDPHTKIFTTYNTASGLENTEYNFNAYYKTKKGEMLFGGINGFTMFNPEDIQLNNFIPAIAFTSLKQNNKIIHAGDKNGPLSAEINKSKSITFKYNEANFSIGFSALDFFSPKNNHYAYKLEGLDRDWIYSIGETEANYTLQNNGTYVFKVKGGNSDGLWNPEERSIEIIVLPPPWRSWWAYSIYFLLVLTAAYALYRYISLQHKLQLQGVARQQQEELHEVKLRFFTNITHELRTPLTLILGPIKDLIEKNHSEEVKHKLSMIDKNANRLLNLVNQILIFRKMASDHEPLHITKGDFVFFLKEIFLPFQETAKSKNITYTFESSEEEIFLWFDEEKIEKVFFNLLANAFKFTPFNGSIHLKLSLEKNHVFIEVTDDGIGIEESLHDQIFQRFYEKEASLHSEIKGSGIGLAISKELVELHHGEIKVKSTPHQGSTFSVRLPMGNSHFSSEDLLFLTDDWSKAVNHTISDPEKSVMQNSDIIIKASDLNHDKTLPSILIIEDNPEVLLYLKDIFKEEYNVYEAENGQEGIKMVKSIHPDLIISDVMMPVMDGITLAKLVKTDIETSHVPIILLTARTASLYKIEGLTMGADDYITKPFDPNELKLKVRNILHVRKEIKNRFARILTFDPKAIDITSADETFLTLAMELIEKNMENPDYHIDQFASDLSVSRPLLFTKLKALTDQTPNNFIKTIKLKRAAQLLQLQKLNVSEVAYKVGFQDPKYFRKCFQAQFDVSPSEFAKASETASL